MGVSDAEWQDLFGPVGEEIPSQASADSVGSCTSLERESLPCVDVRTAQAAPKHEMPNAMGLNSKAGQSIRELEKANTDTKQLNKSWADETDRNKKGTDKKDKDKEKKDKKGKKDKDKKNKDKKHESEGNGRKRKSPDDISGGNVAELRSLLENCRDALVESLTSSAPNIKSDLDKFQVELQGILTDIASTAPPGDTALEKHWIGLACVAGAVSQHPQVLRQEPFRQAVSRARRHHEHLGEKLAHRQAELEAKKRSVCDLFQTSETAAQSRKGAIIERHHASLNLLLERHAKELADLKQKHAQEFSTLSSSSAKLVATAKAQRDVKIAETEAKHKPRIGSIEKQLAWYGKRLCVKSCEFCDFDFFVDEKPKWNEKWGGLHCGDCTLGECPECGAGKMEPEGTCDNPDCSSGSYIYTCPSCSKFACTLCEDCENDDGLHHCGQCGEFYHDGGEACCKYQRYGNPKFGMLKQNYAEVMGSWPV